MNQIIYLNDIFTKYNSTTTTLEYGISIHTIKNKKIENSDTLNKLINKNKPFTIIWDNVKITVTGYEVNL